MRTSGMTPLARAAFPSQRLLAWLCALMLLASVLPLYAISLYNHPYYDDYGFSAASRAAWLATGSLCDTLSAALQSAREERLTWQGTYTGTLLSNLQPGLFSERLYFLTTFLLLSVLMLCAGYFLHTVFRRLLHATREESVMLVCLPLFLMIQFMPDTAEAFYWFNGGIGNVFVYSLLLLSFALLMRLLQAEKRSQRAALFAALVPLCVALGGGSYGGGLLGLLVFAAFTGYAFVRKRRACWLCALATLLFFACFLYSVTAPGNAARARLIGYTGSPVKAVAQALYYGAALMADYASLPLLAVGLILLPTLARLAKNSTLSFRHPLPVLAAGALLFCAQLTPPLYAGVHLGGGRTYNTYYISFVMLFWLGEFYVIGAVLRRVRGTNGLPGFFARYRRLLALGSLLLLLTGLMGVRDESSPIYGPQNLPGARAALSLLNGEAKRYDREMSEREALLNDSSLAIVTLKPLSTVPGVFMDDLLTPDALYDVRPSLCAYYQKQGIALDGEEGSHADDSR